MLPPPDIEPGEAHWTREDEVLADVRHASRVAGVFAAILALLWIGAVVAMTVTVARQTGARPPAGEVAR